MSWVGDLLSGPSWPLALILIYPLAAVLAIELASGLDSSDKFLAGVVRQAAYGLLPTGAIWLILTRLAGNPPENTAVRVAETGFTLVALYLVLKVAQGVLAWLIGNEHRAPKLLLDTVRILLALLWSAVVVSRIWNIDLGSLIAAMGVGSIVLGFALQEYLGNLLAGLELLSARKFEIGDWLLVDGRPQKVVAFDWRSATLIDAENTTTVVANSSLAKGNLVIEARADEAAWAKVPLTLWVDIPPEEARAAILEVAASMPGLPAGMNPRCLVTGIADQRVSYLVWLPIADPSSSLGPKDEFLSRLWYVAQRRGLRLEHPRDPVKPPSGRRLIEESGVLRRHPDVLASVAEPGALHRYRRGEVLLAEGSVPGYAFIVAAGSLAVLVRRGDDFSRLETLEAGNLLLMQETINGTASPLRVVADSNADVVAIPRAALLAAMHEHPEFARDIGALAETRRQAVAALQRGVRRVA
jgi:small-conductance mechanosensitive channel